MTIDISTMSLMVSVASILQSITLIFLVFLANQYRGISIYAIGTILSALGFLIFPMRLFLSDKLLLLNVRFFGNLFIICAQIMYTIGIGKFIGKRINYLFFIALSSASCVIQFYFIYIKDDYYLRHFSIMLPIIIANLLAIHYLISNQDKSLLSSSVFTSIIFLFYVIFSILRMIMVPLVQTTSLMQPNSINIITLWAIFLFDYLRNSGFIMIVNQRLHHDLHTLATTDFLTKALNRRAIENYLQYEITRFKRSEIPFSLILIDVDKFKLINDNYGHTFGDIVLQHLVNILNKSLRSQDLVSRWGGEEFLILLPNTNIESASVIANRLRITVEENPAADGMIYYTISLGVATFEKTYTNSLSSFFIALDQALYQAKKKGRNQIVIVPKVQ
ncbi:GGDEF domain-containing protein [Anabaena cylindrica UHCC 0172]|uniref:GGDEF domain-containing protein n=1 Tax=Anabaena cylindrica TaxID=1165 RepID=UPI002B20435A|nr:GGDEF domain-containing protein [Anabaena cylindrica]MEA5554458.1 GGDEF domain-containing protein [Anabaena cylindrica UHCC 0172]